VSDEFSVDWKVKVVLHLAELCTFRSNGFVGKHCLIELVLIINEASTVLMFNLFRNILSMYLFINENTRSTAAFEPGNEKENLTTIKYTIKFYIELIKMFSEWYYMPFFTLFFKIVLKHFKSFKKTLSSIRIELLQSLLLNCRLQSSNIFRLSYY